jgi:hypothetical protein
MGIAPLQIQLSALQAYNPGYINTRIAFKRNCRCTKADWTGEIGNVAANYVWQDKYDSLLVLYRDTLVGQGFQLKYWEFTSQ